MVFNPKLSRAHFLGEDLYVHSVREQPLPVVIQLVVSRRTEVTIVGLKTWEENTGDPDPEMSWEAAFQEIVDEERECTPDWNPVPKVRTLTIEEWRKEISEEEWVAVESLPGCCWEMCANYEAELVS